MSSAQVYTSPLGDRYASREMSGLFTKDKRFQTWRRLWVALAEAQQELGLAISDEQIAELRAHVETINYPDAEAKEREIRHDVMAHVYAYGLQCPAARPIIHLGATSCYVTDNTDLLIYRDALGIIRRKLLSTISQLAAFAEQTKEIVTLGYTHWQPAQPVTVGKRACLWLQDFLTDLNDLEYVLVGMRLLGSKGTTGTQASFLELFDGDHVKVEALDKRIAVKMGFQEVYPVSGQTYPRKEDMRLFAVLSGIAQSSYRMAQDIRLLQNMREMEEPFEKNQVGSSAMAYKRNPMRSERICSLARHIMAAAANTTMTAATQGLERTLDDSANRRLTMPEGFLAADGVLNLCINISKGLVVYPKVIEKRLREFLPFIATENILMAAVKKGGDRQALHEAIRVHSMAAGKRMKVEGLACDLLERLSADPRFSLRAEEWEDLLDTQRYMGRAPQQVDAFLDEVVRPLLARNNVSFGATAQGASEAGTDADEDQVRV